MKNSITYLERFNILVSKNFFFDRDEVSVYSPKEMKFRKTVNMTVVVGRLFAIGIFFIWFEGGYYRDSDLGMLLHFSQLATISNPQLFGDK